MKKIFLIAFFLILTKNSFASIKENIISKEELVFNINKNKEDTKLISICLYNNKDDINNIKSNNIITNPNDLIKEINYLEDIIIEDTINYLKNLNRFACLFIIFFTFDILSFLPHVASMFIHFPTKSDNDVFG